MGYFGLALDLSRAGLFFGLDGAKLCLYHPPRHSVSLAHFEKRSFGVSVDTHSLLTRFIAVDVRFFCSTTIFRQGGDIIDTRRLADQHNGAGKTAIARERSSATSEVSPGSFRIDTRPAQTGGAECGSARSGTDQGCG